MIHYPLRAIAKYQYFDEVSGDNAAKAKALTAVTDGYIAIRWIAAGYDDTTGVGTLEVKDGSTVIFTQPIHGDGRLFNFGDYPLVSSKGAAMTVTISAGGTAGNIGYINGCSQ